MIAIATSAAADPPRPPYASLAYANAFGLDIADVPEWGTPVLIRPIPNSDWKDVLGCYPLAVPRETQISKEASNACGPRAL